MLEFLISYWWLLVLGLILVGVITKSLIKVGVTLVFLLVVLVVFWQVLVSSAFTFSTQCFTEGTKSAGAVFEKAKTMNAGPQRNEFICAEDVAGYQKLMDCLQMAQQQNEFGFKIYASLPNFQRTVANLVSSHNQLCPQSPISMPAF